MPQTPCLSVILPCYNVAPFIANTLGVLTRYLDSLDASWEIVLVDDGSADSTVQTVAALAMPGCRLLPQGRNYGKGRAVRAGMLLARGQYRIFTDADLPYGVACIGECLGWLKQGYHMVAGDRRLCRPTDHTRVPFGRAVGSRLFRFLIKLLVTGEELDTQCGLKGFSGPLADCLFPLLTVDRFAFDVELYSLIRRAGVEFKPIPVRLVNNQVSTISLGSDGAQMLRDVARIILRQVRGGYDMAVLQPFACGASSSPREAERPRKVCP